ncbi:hypothetical protein FKP32DRAFT_1543198, partial [Trametes sanguinea]
MNTVNSSTGFSPFQLHLGRSPRLLPPLTSHDLSSCSSDADVASLASDLIKRLESDVMEAQDNLLLAKTQQAHHANKHRGPEDVFAVDDLVMLSTFHRRRDYMQKGDHRVAK